MSVKVVYYRPVHLIKQTRFSTKNPPLELVEEEIGELLSVRRCWLYLEFHHADKSEWSMKDAERLYRIILMILETTDEWDADVFYQPFYHRHGVFTKSRKQMLEYLFSNPSFSVCCIFDPCYTDSEAPGYDIIRFMTDETLYNQFLTFWGNIPTVADYQSALRPHFPKDICNMILTKWLPAKELPCTRVYNDGTKRTTNNQYR
jgi:hypothetical protein